MKKKSSLEIGLVLFTSEFDTSLLTKSMAFTLQGKAAVAEVSNLCFYSFCRVPFDDFVGGVVATSYRD